MDPLPLEGTEEKDTSLEDELEVPETLETFDVHEFCDEFDDHDDY